MLRYRYGFTSPEKRAETGEWWTRQRVGTYVEPMTGEEPGRRLLVGRGFL